MNFQHGENSKVSVVLPELRLLLKPHSKDGAADYIDVRMDMEQPRLSAGTSLLVMPLITVSIPTCRYDGDAVKAYDDRGELLLVIKDEEPTPEGINRKWLAARETEGNVTVYYRAFPRKVSKDTRPGPYYDLRCEAGGLNGAGISFLALPDTDITYNIKLMWDIEGMPEGTRAVWSFGEGDITKIGRADLLAYTYYAVGPLKSCPDNQPDRFTMYWLEKPSFDTNAVAEKTRELFDYMSEFFRDGDDVYKIFVRKNPYRNQGGTAAYRSFMFGYSDFAVPTVKSLQGLLAHEMVHNWPSIENVEGEYAWYGEGAAEYYSIMLSYRAGVITIEEFLEDINRKASNYYTNPLRSLTNCEASDRFWSDSNAQRLPYGRGFMYLVITNARIREKSLGKRNLDDVVLEMLRRKNSGEHYGINEWLELLNEEIGLEAKVDYEYMFNGGLLVPPENSFESRFNVVRHKERCFELGFKISSLYSETKTIDGLIEKSNAALAGLLNGDKVIEHSALVEVQNNPALTMKLKVRRGTEEFEISYLPLGEEVESYRWVKR
jgi:hypothetical protein